MLEKLNFDTVIHKNFKNGNKNPKDMEVYKYKNSQKPAIKQYNYKRCYSRKMGNLIWISLPMNILKMGQKNTKDMGKNMKNINIVKNLLKSSVTGIHVYS